MRVPGHEGHKCISFSFTHFHLPSSLSEIISNPIFKVVIGHVVRLLHSRDCVWIVLLNWQFINIETLAKSFFESSHVNVGTEHKNFPVTILRT